MQNHNENHNVKTVLTRGRNVNKNKPCTFSSSGALSWTTTVGDVGGGGALRLVLFSDDSAEDPRLKPDIYMTTTFSNQCK